MDPIQKILVKAHKQAKALADSEKDATKKGDLSYIEGMLEAALDMFVDDEDDKQKRKGFLDRLKE